MGNSKNICEERVCECVGGVAAKGLACPAKGEKMCATCDKGYHGSCTKAQKKALFNKTNKKWRFKHYADKVVGDCLENVCLCPTGVAARGADCPNHGDKKCKECNDGYDFDPVDCTCTERVCKCENGIPNRGSDCKTIEMLKAGKICSTCKKPTEQSCVKCNQGFEMNFVTN